jgi:hypothetical protein
MNIIIIPVDIFLQRKENYEKSSCIKSKYDAMHAKYECFLKANNLYFHKYNKNEQVLKKRNYSDRPPKEPKKTLQSLWNILNESNYQKITHKLKFLINEDNLVHVVTDILRNSIIHATYRKYFLLILTDILSNNNKEIVIKTIKDFYNDYISNRKYEFPVTGVENDYDLFCRKQKHKQTVINTNKLFMDIVDMIPELGIDISGEYVDMLFTNLEKEKDNEFYIDLYLNIMIDCVSKYKESFIKKSLLLNEVLKENVSMKNKFMIEKFNALLIGGVA